MKEGDVFIPYKVFIGVFIPNCVLEAEDLPPSAKLLYGVLSSYSGKNGRCYPSQAVIAEKVKLKEDTVYRLLHILSMGGYIKIIPPSGINRLKHYNNEYKFLWKETFDEDVKQEQPSGKGSGSGTGKRSGPDTGKRSGPITGKQSGSDFSRSIAVDPKVVDSFLVLRPNPPPNQEEVLKIKDKSHKRVLPTGKDYDPKSGLLEPGFYWTNTWIPVEEHLSWEWKCDMCQLGKMFEVDVPYYGTSS